MDKRLYIQLNGKRALSGVLRGYDPFLNIVLDDVTLESMSKQDKPKSANTNDPVAAEEKQNLGSVVIRGNSIVMMEALERV